MNLENSCNETTNETLHEIFITEMLRISCNETTNETLQETSLMKC